MAPAPYIAVTDLSWFDFLAAMGDDRGRLDEVNFWNPSGRPLKRLRSGEPLFLRLKAPRNVIAGYGFFAHFSAVPLDEAWACFGEKNGAASLLALSTAIGRYRSEDEASLICDPPVIGCTILRDAVFWRPDRWIPWGRRQGWHPSQMRGATEHDPERAQRLLAEIVHDHQQPPRELVESFRVREVDRRKIVESRTVLREGQGTFRAVLLDAYGRRCSITGERTEPVLDAAHIQPYLGPESNHVQNGLLLTKEFHRLFDLGYVAITPSYEVRVSPRLRERWKNGRRYYVYDGERLANIPEDRGKRPSSDALAWHLEERFQR